MHYTNSNNYTQKPSEHFYTRRIICGGNMFQELYVFKISPIKGLHANQINCISQQQQQLSK